MKIIYLHQYFKTPEEGGGIRSYYLAKALTETGFEVKMITTWNEKQYQIKNIEGISVHYIPIYYENNLGFWQRIRAFVVFIRKAFVLACKLATKNEKALCYATSTPLTVGIIALFLKLFRRIPYYFEVRDLWPLIPIKMGYIRNAFLQKFLYFLEKTIYKHAEKIITLSPAMMKWVEHYEVSSPIYCIPNMADCEWFENKNSGEITSSSENFTVTYAGTLGEANSLESLLEIALYCQQKQISGIKFMIVGKGKQEAFLKQKASAYQLQNLTFLSHTNKEEIRKILSASQAVYISFAPFSVLETTSPNKFFDGLAAGKLIITNTGGWIKELIETYECGFYANTPQEFLEKILPFINNRALLWEWEKNARKLAKQQFDRKLLTKKFIALFPEVLEKSREK
jgi:glycosyltransferase involved in cell wall biosynthesis